MHKFKTLLSVPAVLFLAYVMFTIHISIKAMAFILKTVFYEIFSTQGMQKLTENSFYGSILVLILHFSEVSVLALSNIDLVIFICWVILIKPLEKIIIKLS